MDNYIWIRIYMWIWLGTRCKADVFPDEFEKNLTKENQIFQEKYIHYHKECLSKRWFCSRECRLQFFENTGSCRVPDKDETCFGVPIKHNYTWNQNVKHFPKELQVLKRFPRCWASLGPLICSSIYRPCSKNAYIEYSMKTPEFVELWQVFPSTLCQNAKKECSFVATIGLWPEFLNCDNNVELIDGFPTHENVEQEQRLFTNQTSCKITNLPSEVNFDSSQCLWPLIKGLSELEQSGTASAVMDSCYMPCETPLAGFTWMLETFRRRNAVISFFSAVAFLFITVYLLIFSKIYQTSLSIFCMTQGFVCMIIYLLCWSLTIFKEIRQSLLCVDNGKIRKLLKIEFLDHCTLESILTNFTLFTSISWLFIMLILRIIRPKIRNDNYFVFGSRGNKMNSRTLLVTIIYILLPIGLIFKTIFLWKNIPVDVISGICHIGAGNFEHWLYYYSTIGGFILLIVISWLIIICKKMIQTKTLNESLKKCGQTNSQRKSLISSIEISENETEKLKVDNEKEVVNSFVLENGIGDELIPDYWLGSVFGAIVMTFLIGGFLQATIINDNIGENYEREMIRKSIHCSLKTLTTEFHTNWWNKTINYDHLTTIFDPYKRKEMLFDSVTAPGCELEILKQTKLLTIFFTWIILPCLPYWILAVCFFAGFCNNGLKNVRKIRTKFNPFLYEKVKSIDGFLQSSNDSKNMKENVKIPSESTIPTHDTAPTIMQAESFSFFISTSEFEKKLAKQPIIEVSALEIVAGDVSSGDEDDIPQPQVFHWSLPNPPPEVLQYRFELATGEKKIEFEYPPDSCSSLFFRLMAHCTIGLPQWLMNPFVRACLERYEELYLENDDRSTYFAERKIYPNIEALEAATYSNLTSFLFPIICKAIADASADLYMDSRWFFRSISPWISDQLEMSRFEAHIIGANLQSIPEDF